jgi:Flp pilus assembly pilin Flp
MIDRSRLRLALLRRRAAGMVEYGALAALIAVAALGAVLMLGQRITDMLERAADVLTSPVFAWSGGGTFTLTSPTGNPSVVDRTFILTNIGSVAGTPEVPTVSGSGPGYVFSLVAHDCNRVLAAGETCSATVRATYTANVAAATGTLGGSATLGLTGSASGFGPAWAFDAEPDGNMSIPAYDSIGFKVFTLRNIGTLAGNVPTHYISGPHSSYFALFSLGFNPCRPDLNQIIAPNAACTIGVGFWCTNTSSLPQTLTATLIAGTASKPLSGRRTGCPSYGP